MRKIILIIFEVLFIAQLPAQNLVTNPDAESLPRGTGWTIISEGAFTCALIPTNNYLKWTMKPDGSANYPFDHTTGAPGGTVFFSGCDTYFGGPFELQQTIDVSADAANIDLGNQLYVFSGYMQTPVTDQTDQGRFVVNFLNASNNILGTSYTSNWQSHFGGSGNSWINYTNTRTAPAGTRKVRIRMQTQLLINQPAINVYFDDISLTKPTVVPLGLLSFTGMEVAGNILLNWKLADELSCKQFDLERSSDAIHFNRIATLPAAGNTSFQFVDHTNSPFADNIYYRLKITGTDNKTVYSNIVLTRISGKAAISLSPNPANDVIRVTGLPQPGIVSIINYDGSELLTANTNASLVTLDISRLPAGAYIVRFISQNNSINKKLVIRQL